MDAECLKAFFETPRGVYDPIGKEVNGLFQSLGATTGVPIAGGLKETLDTGYKPLFMPEFALVNLEAIKLLNMYRLGEEKVRELSKGELAASKIFVTPSLKASGRTQDGSGSKVVVYVHIPNPYSNPECIVEAVNNRRLRKGAGPISQNDFDYLVSLDGNGRVFVVDGAARRAQTETLEVDNALKDPHVIPFLGGEAAATRFLSNHKQYYGDLVDFDYVDDFDEETPRGRLIGIGSYGMGASSRSLCADLNLDSDGTFFGVNPLAAAGLMIGDLRGLEGRVEKFVEVLEGLNAVGAEPDKKRFVGGQVDLAVNRAYDTARAAFYELFPELKPCK